MRLLTVVLTLLLAGCFKPNVQDGGYDCGPGNTCPPGFQCRACDQKCWINPTVLCTADAAIIDVPFNMMADARTGDARVFDAKTSDMVVGGPCNHNNACEPQLGENCVNCTDCGTSDGICARGNKENCSTCPGDCGACVCDGPTGLCDLCSNETCITCPDQCGVCQCNGSTVCGVGECQTCPWDCPPTMCTLSPACRDGGTTVNLDGG